MSLEVRLSSSSSGPLPIERAGDEKDVEIPSKSSLKDEGADDGEGPELVPVESSEDSESDERESSVEDNVECEEIVPANDEVGMGMIDCISDQFSNMFCTGIGPQELCVAHSDNETLAKESSCAVFDAADPSNDVFAHLNFWWSPGGEAKHKTSSKPQNRSNQPRHKARHIHSLLDNWHPTAEEPLVRSKSILDDKQASFVLRSHVPDGFYDSDPEEGYKKKERGDALKQAPESYTDRRPGPISTICETQAISYDEEYKPHPPAPRNYTKRSFSFRGDPRDRSPTSLCDYEIMHPSNDDYIRNFVQEVQNTRLKLIWHRYNDPEDSEEDRLGLRAPRAVMATFEVGTHLDCKVVQPKLTWSSAKKDQGEKRMSQNDSDWIELLSIIRVVTPNRLNRKHYPFARTDRTFCVITNDNRNPYLVFEADSSAQRDWFVTALKMTVARLASIIIVKNEGMLMEFFSPYAALAGLGEHENPSLDDDEEPEEEDSNIDAVPDDQADLALENNGEIYLMNLSPVLFNPKDL